MRFRVPRNRRLERQLGQQRTAFLEAGLNAIARILPHVETLDWVIDAHAQTQVSWEDNRHRQINITLGIATGDGHSVSFRVRRLSVPRGVGAIQRMLDPREREICETIVVKLLGGAV
jgi:hypothetical protein